MGGLLCLAITSMRECVACFVGLAWLPVRRGRATLCTVFGRADYDLGAVQHE